ncbi:class I SAM-dependent methyltransferase [Brachybacterium halotolerans subsp. kimchii]|uniref:class I SAM-dependent methyltransferase n=1 Tax=Brachybacterium halotolerans TaxID=2795215 RepID=UPI001E2FCF14|nr:class I SAM-dependent methyltransferase [Brachybacterium halotolerans]UEJ84248.1 class I SAM-dependent methyltransferase [Brachybacterium halotolerans subsp. kimchii]
MSDPAVPPVSSRDTPRFGTRERHRQLGAAFQGQGGDYDRLRPGYPPEVLDAILAALPSHDGAVGAGGAGGPAGEAGEPGAPAGASAGASAGTTPGATPAHIAVDLGAGTGKLSLQLARRGLDVIAVDPSRSMLETAEQAYASMATSADGRGGPVDPVDPDDPAGPIGSLRAVQASAEDTGLPDASADLVSVAQAWHWFDTEAAGAEIARILGPGGVLALLWNSLDVQIPWVHRYSRIMHAGDVYRDDFSPPITPHFTLRERVVQRWEDPRTTHELIDLARTRSYVITAPPERREKVLANLDWYLHEHLGHTPGSEVGMPYRTDLFLFAAEDA